MTRLHPIFACAGAILALLSMSMPLPAGELPAWWPEDVPVLDDAPIVKVDDAKDKGLPEVEFRVPAEGHSMESLVTSYVETLQTKGWTIDQRRSKGMSDSVTMTKRSIDKRVIVTAWKPGTMFNKNKDAFKLDVIVYTSLP